MFIRILLASGLLIGFSAHAEIALLVDREPLEIARVSQDIIDLQASGMLKATTRGPGLAAMATARSVVYMITISANADRSCSIDVQFQTLGVKMTYQLPLIGDDQRTLALDYYCNAEFKKLPH